jgi:hypothetical protein
VAAQIEFATCGDYVDLVTTRLARPGVCAGKSRSSLTGDYPNSVVLSGRALRA